MSINVWISSVLKSSEGMDYLFDAINSTSLIEHLGKLVISIYTDQNIDRIKGFLLTQRDKQPNVEYMLKVRDEPLDQFEHIRLLTNEEDLNENDVVILLDDDDMFTDSPEKYLSDNVDGFVGYHYIPQKDNLVIYQSETLTFGKLKEFVEIYNIDMERVDDFSGTTIRYKYLKMYFGSDYVAPQFRQLEDTTFMNFVDNLPQSLNIMKIPNAQPYIFHRLKDKPSLWKETLLTQMQNFLSSSKSH